MTKMRRHHFEPADVAADWRGVQLECRRCPLPRDNEVHAVPELDDEQRAAEMRRTGERE